MPFKQGVFVLFLWDVQWITMSRFLGGFIFAWFCTQLKECISRKLPWNYTCNSLALIGKLLLASLWDGESCFLEWFDWQFRDDLLNWKHIFHNIKYEIVELLKGIIACFLLGTLLCWKSICQTCFCNIGIENKHTRLSAPRSLSVSTQYLNLFSAANT